MPLPLPLPLPLLLLLLLLLKSCHSADADCHDLLKLNGAEHTISVNVSINAIYRT